MADLPVTIAILLEKTQKIKDKVAEIDKKAGSDDALFRKLVLGYIRPDLKAEVTVTRRV